MSQNKTIPKISDILPLDKTPDFIQKNIGPLFKNIHYRDYYGNTSKYKESGSYSLVLVTKDILRIEFPGTDGMALLFNPAVNNSENTELFVALSYRLEILRYLRGYSFSQFSNDPLEVFNILLEILKIPLGDILDEVISIAIDAPDPYQFFVNDFNSKYSPNPAIVLNSGQDSETIIDIAIQIEDRGFSIEQVAYDFLTEGFSSVSDLINQVKKLFTRWLGNFEPNDLWDLFIPKVFVSLKDLNLALEFPRKYLLPLDSQGEIIEENHASLPDKSRLTFIVGSLNFSTEHGFSFEGENGFSLNRSQIGKTGLELFVSGGKLDLSRNKNIQEATADKRPPDFIGAYIADAAITLPKKWFKNQPTAPTIFGKNLLIGTGGISGTIGLEADLTVNLGKEDGFQIKFTSFDMTFQQNAIVESNIKGELHIKGFKDAGGNDAVIEIDVHFGENGDFKITATEQTGFSIHLANILNIVINSLEVGRVDDRFYLEVTGKLSFEPQDANSGGGFIKDNLPKDIDIQGFRIWENGKFEIKGGGIKLRKPFTLPLGPVNITVTGLHLGAHEQFHGGQLREYRYVGFDGGISVKPGGVDARGDGIKFYFTSDGLSPRHVFIRIQSIAIDIIIPGNVKPEDATLLLKGYLAMKDPGDDSDPNAGTEYAGGIEFTLPKLKMAGSAKMRYNPKVPSFLIDIGLELGNPLLLGSTGLGIYGFRALIGRRYVATKQAAGLTDEDLWYQYYKAKVAEDYRVGIQPGKFEQKRGFSAGAGVSLGTAADTGFTFSAKVFLLLSLPDVFLIEGQGQVLKKRIGLNDTNEPPFYAFIAITKTSAETALGVNYKSPDSGANAGSMVTVDGVIEIAFFFGEAFSWYINLGRDLPEAKRIRARILDLLDCYFYLMVSSSGIRMGAGAAFEWEKKIGPFGVYLSAWMDTAARWSFKPKQLGGSIDMGAELRLKIWKFKFSLSVEAGLAAEVPKPFIIQGHLKACVRVIRKKKCVTVKLIWKRDPSPNLIPLPLLDASKGVKAKNILTQETYQLLHIQHNENPSSWGSLEPIPLDSEIEIQFRHPVDADGTSADFYGVINGAGNEILVPPQRGESPRVSHKFYVDNILIKIHNPSNNTWQPYRVYEALTAYDSDIFDLTAAELASFKQGAWQTDSSNKLTKVHILSRNPISYVTQGGNLPENFQITSETLFCEDIRREKVCIPIEAVSRTLDDESQGVPGKKWTYANGANFYLIGEDAPIVDKPFNGHQKALLLESGQVLEVAFVEPTNCVDITLHTDASNVKLSFFNKVKTAETDINDLPIFDYQLLSENWYSSGIFNPALTYESETAFNLVLIEAAPCESGSLVLKADSEMSIQTNALRAFLDFLAQQNRLLESPIKLSEEYNLFKYPFFETALFNASLSAEQPVICKTQKQGDFILKMEWFGKADFYEYLELIVKNPDSGFDFAAADFFNNVRYNPDKVHTGVNYDFLMDMLVGTNPATQKTYVLAAKSSYPAFNVYPPNQLPQSQFTAKLDDIFETLKVLNQEDVLTGMRAVEIRNGKYKQKFSSLFDLELFQCFPSNEKIYYKIKNRPTNRLKLLFWTKEDSDLEITLHAGRRGSFSFDEIVQIVSIEQDDTFSEQGLTSFKLKVKYKAGRRRLSAVLKGYFAFRGKPDLVDITLSSDGDLECGETRIEAHDLQNLFNKLIDYNDFKKPWNLMQPGKYQSTFWDTSLYDGSGQFINYKTNFEDEAGHIYQMILDDTKGWTCTIRLDATVGPHPPYFSYFNFYNILFFGGIRPDPDYLGAGPNYHFLIEAYITLNDPEALDAEALNYYPITLRGTSCYPIVDCEQSECFTHFYKICHLKETDYSFNQTIPSQHSIDLDNLNMAKALSKTIQPVWSPHRNYLIEIHGRDVVAAEGSSGIPHSQTYKFGFKTAGGIGFFHNYLDGSTYKDRRDFKLLKDKDEDDAFRLLTLNHYINYPRCFPNADGRLTGAKPLYFGTPTLLLFFKKQYVMAMFSAWGLYENNPERIYWLEATVAEPINEEVIRLEAKWVRNDFPLIGEDLNALNNLIVNGVVCSGIQKIESFGINPVFDLPDIEPEKTYAAIFKGKFQQSPANVVEREVHKYNFMTSQFRDFEDHIYSYRLKDEQGQEVKEAVFEIDRTFDPVDLANASRIIDDPNDESNDQLITQFVHPFDRLMDGAFKLGALAPAMTTEFNIIRMGSRILGVLVRSPEPFNDPKMPEDEMADTLQLKVNGNSGFSVLFSKDNAKAFISNDDGGMNMPTGQYQFTFRYKLFDGAGFEDMNEINDIEFDVI